MKKIGKKSIPAWQKKKKKQFSQFAKKIGKIYISNMGKNYIYVIFP